MREICKCLNGGLNFRLSNFADVIFSEGTLDRLKLAKFTKILNKISLEWRNRTKI